MRTVTFKKRHSLAPEAVDRGWECGDQRAGLAL